LKTCNAYVGVVALEASGRKQVDVTRVNRTEEEETASLIVSAAGIICAGVTVGGRLVRSARLAAALATALCASYFLFFSPFAAFEYRPAQRDGALLCVHQIYSHAEGDSKGNPA